MKKDSQNIVEVIDCQCSFSCLLTDNEKEELKANLTIQKFKKSEIIYKEGDVPQNLLCLITGKVKIYKDGVGGRTQIMQAIRPSSLFGYRAYFANQNYITAAAAFETSTIAMIPMNIVAKWCEENSKLSCFFLKSMAVELGNTQERIVNLTQKHIRGRLAEAILFLKENFGVEEDGVTLSISLSREDMANLSNMTTSNAIRTLSAFATENLIRLEGRRIVIEDEEKLRHISKMG
ncbi:MAG: Crp/Fnr family transcriptional regulator [Bacteroidaceae bacterium]|jgi:CRP-like cAMP-binding protein|nr:Crp/Fnr family transcriptional regulator [Bacteroidaceae bacterium]